MTSANWLPSISSGDVRFASVVERRSAARGFALARLDEVFVRFLIVRG